MTFLQPALLFGLPLLALPILIHLINKWRHRTLPWGAMMFLLDAKRMTRGMARLRFWLIMLSRMLAIALLFMAVARPLTTGWAGLAIGSRADTTIILLDRSASMEQQDLQSGRSKRASSLAELASMFEVTGGGTRVVLIESTEKRPRELDSANPVLDLPDAAATSTSADMPALFQAALDYAVANQTGRTDIWVCSDARQNDWHAEDGRWTAIRDGFQRLQGVRFYLLNYSQPAGDNIGVRVSNVRQRESETQRELTLDVALCREATTGNAVKLPIVFNINGTRSVVNLEMEGDEYVLQGHKIPLDETTEGGWGRVELPADENLIDNVYYFTFSAPAEHHTTIVYEDSAAKKPMRLASTAPLDPGLNYTVTELSAEQANEVDWSASSLVLWQAPLPEGQLAEQLTGFVRGGRPVIFFPPEEGVENSIFGMSWGEWRGETGEQFTPVASWRNDDDLLANARGGESLAVGKLRAYRYREILGKEGNPLARLQDGAPLLTRATADGGPVYFCSTLPVTNYSSLAQDGLAFYAMIQRALTIGAATQGKARQIDAGSEMSKAVDQWRPAADSTREVPLSARWVNAGAYENGDRWLALNRPSDEQTKKILSTDDIGQLLRGLDYRNVERKIGDAGSLSSEIWRAFLVLMGTALFAEALLCLPERKG
jgi:hypothetical protein